MSRPPGLGLELEQYAAHLPVVEPDIVGPFERNAARPGTCQRARHRNPYPQTQGRQRPGSFAEGPAQRHRQACTEGCNPAATAPTAARLLKLAEAGVRAAVGRR